MTSKKSSSSEWLLPEEPAAASVEPFEYRPAPGWVPRGATGAGDQFGRAPKDATLEPAASPDRAAMEEGAQVREKQAREEGFREGLARGRAEAETATGQQREAIAEAVRAFGREREIYFHHVEAEVVTLALAVARKILRREAQVDPLLLTGLVRVALEKIAVSKNVRLRVHPSQISAWQDHFSQNAGLTLIPELSGDAGLEQNQCKLETELGCTELNVETQLKEIEQGLFDLLAQRPTPR
ncbi:MAG: hypothetical protein LAN59_15520 [Acidobacteriia bacterium]|nr:hypothetical protein [Terriglobia bacterium]